MVMDVTAADGTVIVAGSINVDLIVGVTRLPTAGETVQGDRFVQQNGGKGANQAVAASRAGAHVVMLGAVGGDDLGSSALAGLAEEGVDVTACRRLEEEHTGLALIVVDAAGENQIAVAPGANARLDAAMIASQTAGLRPPAGSVCLVGFEVFDDAVLAAARWAADLGLRIILNPAPGSPPARGAAGPAAPSSPPTSARRSCSRARPTRRPPPPSSRGGRDPRSSSRSALRAPCSAPTVESSASPATPVTPLDTTGAGDALNGILAAELSRGSSLETALRWAMVGAALKTTQAGAQAGLPTRAAIAAHLSDA